MAAREVPHAGRRIPVAPAAGLVLAGILAAGPRPLKAEASGAADSPPLAQAPDGRPLQLTFSEDFRRFVPGGTWRTTFGDGHDTGPAERTLAGNGEQELYVDPEFGARIGAAGLDPFQVTGGGLEIRAERAPAALSARLGGHGYTSGLISSQPSFSQRYGYFEIRARLPGGKGLWPALWMLPADQTWPPEIDIMESIGDPHEIYVTAHSKVVPANSIKVSVPDDGFHTYAVSWDPKELVWYLDGRETARQATPSDMNKPMFLIANLAVGGTWPGAPDASTSFPAKFSIAYVRAYRFAPELRALSRGPGRAGPPSREAGTTPAAEIR